VVAPPLRALALAQRARLGLSPDQVSRLEALRTGFSREAIRREAEIRIVELDLATLLEADPLDLPRVEAKVRELGERQADLRIARLRTIEQGRAVLTPEQRAQLARGVRP
jgi:Spy/CpxP family protein refolding chaperone